MSMKSEKATWTSSSKRRVWIRARIYGPWNWNTWVGSSVSHKDAKKSEQASQQHSVRCSSSLSTLAVSSSTWDGFLIGFSSYLICHTIRRSRMTHNSLLPRSNQFICFNVSFAIECLPHVNYR